MIVDLSFKERAVLFAKLSDIAYLEKADAKKKAKELGFTTIEYYDRDGAQAYRFMNKKDLVIACRGTQPTQWNDIKADLKAIPVMAETIGRVHRGFKKEVDDLWPMVREDLLRKTNLSKTIWFTGHSLGAAMATIMASRCMHDEEANYPAELYTYGSPRVGWSKYCNSLGIEHHRFVNNNDIVTRVPLWIMGYRHHGKKVYFNRHGKVSKVSLVDRLLGMWNGIKRLRFDNIADHAMPEYMKNCEKI